MSLLLSKYSLPLSTWLKESGTHEDAATFGIMILSLMTLSITIIIITTIRRMTLSIKIICITTLGAIKLSIMTLSITIVTKRYLAKQYSP